MAIQEIRNFLIIPEKELLVLSCTNETNHSIHICGNENDAKMLDIISNLNRRHMVTCFEQQPVKDGCLPTKCLGIENPSVNISPKYLVHCFINIMEMVFGHDGNVQMFARNKDAVELPTSKQNLEKIMTAMLDTEAMEDEDDIDVNDDQMSVNFKMLLRVMLDKLFTMQRTMTSTISKNASKLHKKSSFVGGINQDLLKQMSGGDEDVLSKGLQDCSEVIHASMRRNAELIQFAVLDPNNAEMTAVKRIMDICNHHCLQPLYANLDVTFELMYQSIGEIFNALFFNIIPKYSMMEAMQGAFYNAAVLSELKLQERFPDIVCVPILYRFIHCCFKDESNPNMEVVSEEYFQQNYPGILNQIDRLQQQYNNDDDDDKERSIDILCTIAMKSNIKDEEFNRALYWVLNRKRSCTFEYYIILMTVLYLNSRCSNVNTHNKRGNAKTFISPIYVIMKLFYGYVRELGIEVSLCSATIDNFSTLYQRELKQTLELFVKSIF